MKTFKQFVKEGQIGSDRLLGGLMRKVHTDIQKKYDEDKLKPKPQPQPPVKGV